MKPQIFNASDWVFTPVKGKDKSFLVEFEDAGVRQVDFEARSAAELVVNAVTEDGELLLLDRGRNVSFSGRIRGFRAIEIIADAGFAYRAVHHGIQVDDFVDPVPAAVNAPLSPYDAMRIAVREEVVRRLHAAGLLTEDVDPDELLEDALHSDHEWLLDDEDDGFTSESYEDMLEPREAPDQSGPDTDSGPPTSEDEVEPSESDEVAPPKPKKS